MAELLDKVVWTETATGISRTLSSAKIKLVHHLVLESKDLSFSDAPITAAPSRMSNIVMPNPTTCLEPEIQPIEEREEAAENHQDRYQQWRYYSQDQDTTILAVDQLVSHPSAAKGSRYSGWKPAWDGPVKIVRACGRQIYELSGMASHTRCMPSGSSPAAMRKWLEIGKLSQVLAASYDLFPSLLHGNTSQ